MSTAWNDLTEDEREQALAALTNAAGLCADALMTNLNREVDKHPEIPYRFRVVIELWPTEEESSSNVVRFKR